MEKKYYSVEAVSNSSLSWFEQSPLYFKKLLNKEIQQETFPWATKGQQIHMFLLEPDEFEKNYTHLDYDTPKTEQQRSFCQKISDLGRKNEDPSDIYKEFYSSKGKSDEKIKKDAEDLRSKFEPYLEYLQQSKNYKEILSESTYSLLQDIKSEVLKHDAAARLLGFSEDLFGDAEGFNELPIYFNDVQTGIDCKSLLDRVIIDRKKKEITLIDIKSCNTFKNFKDRIRDFNYDRQLAFYWRALYHHFKDEMKSKEYKFNTYIIAINTNYLVEVKVIKIPEQMIKEADDDVNRKLTRISWHYDNNKWEYDREYYTNDGIESLKL